jgi:hypothetical protein
VHRSVLVVDVEKFGDPARTNADQVAVREGMYQALEGALADAGISRRVVLSRTAGTVRLCWSHPRCPRAGW